MESGSGDTPAGGAFADKRLRDEHVDIPSYVEPPAAGLSSRQKLLYHGSGIVVGLLMAAAGFASWRYFTPDTAEVAPPVIAQQTVSHAPAATGAGNARLYEEQAAAVDKRIAELREQARKKSESLPTY